MQPESGTLFLSAADVHAVLGVTECVEAVEEVFRLWALGEVASPSALGVHVEGGAFHVKAGVLRRGRTWFAAKTNGNFPGNPDRSGLPSIQGLIVLADADDGAPLAVLESSSITELRTAAATAVAARWLARAEPCAVTLVGCGVQAASQLRAVASVRRLGRVTVFDLSRDRAAALAEQVAPELGVPVTPADDLARAAADCDICITCTTSRSAFLHAGMVRPGTFVAAVGADSPEKHEIAPSLMRASTVVVDSLDQARAFGDLRHAIAAGAMQEGDVHDELGAVVAGLAPGRTSPSEVIVFDSTGTGLQDVAAAARAYERAVAEGRGQWVRLAG